jgi:hypothetical protein
MSEVPFSRPRNPALEATELRVNDAPKPLVDFLDGVSHARGQTRNKLVIEILEAWVRERAREMIVVERVVGGNPVVRDLAGMGSE